MTPEELEASLAALEELQAAGATGPAAELRLRILTAKDGDGRYLLDPWGTPVVGLSPVTDKGATP